MTYRFMGFYREQLWLSSPNLAACFLVMATMICISLFLTFIKQRNSYAPIVAIACAAVAIIAQLLLVYTYSRSGYIALAIGLSALIFMTRSKWLFLFGGCFTIFLLLVENGVNRVGTIAEFTDGSIRNRLLLWKGAMAMISDNCHTGTSSFAELGSEYAAWFQPLWLDERYKLMLNDFLTIACAWGIWVSAGIVFIIGFTLFWGWQTQRRSKSPLLAGIICSAITFIVCGIFNNVAFDYVYILSVFLLILVVALVWCAVFSIKNKWWKWRFLWVPAIFVICFSTVFIFTCYIVRSTFPYNCVTMQIEECSVTIVTPKHKIGTIISVVDEKDNLVRFIREKVRPQVDSGYKVYFAIVDNGLDGLNETQKLLRFALADSNDAQPVLLLDGMAGKQMFIAAAETLIDQNIKILIYNFPETWTMDRLSPVNFVHKIRGDITFIEDQERPMKLLQDKMTANSIEFTIVNKDK